MKKYNTFKDIVSESTLLSFSDFSYENKMSSFNVTIGESYSVKVKKDRQNGKFEFEMTDKFGNTKTYSEKKFISMFPEAYVKFKGELHDKIAKDDPELKDLDKMDKNIIKEDAIEEDIVEQPVEDIVEEPVDRNIEFLFKQANPIDTDINSLVIVDFKIPKALNADFDSDKLFHLLVSIPRIINDTHNPLIIKTYRYPIDGGYVLGKGYAGDDSAEKEFNADETLEANDFEQKYSKLNKMLLDALMIYSAYLNKYEDDANKEFTTSIAYKD